MKQSRRKTTRVDTSTSSQPLTDNPFAALQSLQPTSDKAADLPAEESPSASKAETPSNAPAFHIQKTRAGNWPLFLEKRAKGKMVTVIRNLSGDLAPLLAQLKKRCGAGGVLRDDTIEIQGDHRKTIETVLAQLLAKK